MDDDAWIAFEALKKWGLPKQNGGDFRSNWGILYPKIQPVKSGYYPSMIEGGDKEKEAVFQYLINKSPIRPEEPICSWEPKEIPAGYYWMLESSPTYHRQGIGEIVNDLAYSNRYVICITTNENPQVRFDSSTFKCAEGMRALVDIMPDKLGAQHLKAPLGAMTIYLPGYLRTYNTVQKVKDVLTSGLFPIWKVKDVRPNSFEKWVVQYKGRVEKLVGKELVI